MSDDKPDLHVIDGGKPRPSRITFGGPSLIVRGEPVAETDFFVVVSPEGEVVGTVVGRFDFSDLPEAYHGLALNWIMQHRAQLVGRREGLFSRYREEDIEPDPPPKGGGVIRRIRDFLRLS
jgi:hypothetical protein